MRADLSLFQIGANKLVGIELVAREIPNSDLYRMGTPTDSPALAPVPYSAA